MMDFDQWKIWDAYTSDELTRIVQEKVKRYRINLAYNPRNSSLGGIQEGSAGARICSLDDLLEKGLTSLEMEFLRRSPAVPEKREMIYLWLKFVPKDNCYKLNASIKSICDLNYLRQKHIDTEWDWLA